MFDHLAFNVADHARSEAFYAAALAPLGIRLLEHGADGTMFGKGEARLWISAIGPVQKDLHLAFTAKNREQVDAFHRAALAAGGRDNGAPGLRPHYGSQYYAAFVLDPDGYNIEAVYQHAEA